MQKTAFISGASRGIGRDIAIALAQEGYHLALCCQHSAGQLNELAASLQNTYHIQVLTYMGNVGDFSFVTRMADDILSKWGFIDVIVNNAGISHIGLISDMTVEQWDNLLSVNLSSIFYTTKVFLPSLIQRKQGKIINISSMWGTAGASCEVAYSATKGGMNAYTRALAKELAPSNIQVNAIACGVIDTDMNQCFSSTELQQIMEDIPAGRFGLPADVAQTVLSLIHTSSYLTGQIIGLDGGYL